MNLTSESEESALESRTGPGGFSPSERFLVTLSADEQNQIFGNLTDGQMELSDLGCRIRDILRLMPRRFPNIQIGRFVIQPDRITAIIHLTQGPLNPGISEVMDDFRALTREEYVQILGNAPVLWRDADYRRMDDDEDRMLL